MTTNKKKILIGAAIVVAIILMFIVAFMLIQKFNQPKVTVDELMEKNIIYFENLNSVDSTVLINHDWNLVQGNQASSGCLNIKNNIKRNFKSDESVVEVWVENNNNDNQIETYQIMYFVNEQDEAVTYGKQIFNTVDSGWIMNSTSDRLINLSKASDFDYICKYRNGLRVSKDIVEVDGVRCYKVSGRIYNLIKMAKHYNLAETIGYWEYPLQSFADVTLYFREDNQIIHSFEYDITEYWLKEHDDIIVDVLGNNYLTGNLKVSVLYNDFDSVADIVVSDEIKNTATEELKNPTSEPIDLDDDLYVISIGDVSFKFGEKLGYFAESYQLTPILYDEKIGEETADGILINPHQSFTCSALAENGDRFSITAHNISDEKQLYTDCVFAGISLSENNKSFSEFTLAKNITCNTTLKEMKKILGNYNMKEEMNDYINILWLSYIDWAEVHVYIDYETSQMTYIEVSCFDIESKLGINQNHESVENNEVTEENVTEPTE